MPVAAAAKVRLACHPHDPHEPRIDGRDPSGVAFAYCYGYIQALLDALVPRP